MAACSSNGTQRSAGGILLLEVPSEQAQGEKPHEVAGRMKVGERLEVRLGASAGTGYVWTLAGPVPANMQMTTADPAGRVVPVSGGERLVGGATMTTFGMTAVAQGEGNLRFVLVRPWEKGEAAKPARTVEVSIEVRPADSSSSEAGEPEKPAR
jgi:predicted secreted protein